MYVGQKYKIIIHLWRYFQMAKKYCYLFKEGNAKMREILGVRVLTLLK